MVFVEKLRRPTALVVAVAFLIASIVPLLANGSASAYTLLGDREIKLSTSEGAATGATYAVDFDVATTNNIGGVVIAFCAGASSPIIGDTDCVHPTGFDLTSAGVANLSDGTANTVDMTGFTAAFTDHANAAGTNTLELTNAVATTPALVGDAVQFEITGVVNPSTIGTFYARIMTYDTEAEAQGYTLANEEAGGPVVEAGGIALSTADLITVEAKVQERLTFCVYTSAATYTDCSGNATNPVILGDVNGVLSSTQPSISKDAKYNITTNAGNGATIRLKGDTLASGAFSVDAIGDAAAGDGVPAVYASGTEMFGLCTYEDASSTEAGITPTAEYDGGAGAECSGTTDGQGAANDNSAEFTFFLDGDPTGTAIDSTYGDSIATKTAGDFSTGILVFLGGVDNTTEPGIYTTTLDFIATGRY